MRKTISIVMMLAILLCSVGCSSSEQNTDTVQTNTPTVAPTVAPTEAPTEASTEAPKETKPENGVYGDTLILGNIKFSIPDGYEITIMDENTYMFESDDGDCAFGVFAADISELDEAATEVYLPMQADLFATDGATRVDEDTLDGYVAGFDVGLNFYMEMTQNLDVTTNIDTTFTDSWYAYTIIFRCSPTSEKQADYITTFVQFTGYSEYIGQTPRFDFVQ